MIDISLIRTNRAAVAEALGKRGVSQAVVEELHRLDSEWRELTHSLEDLRAKQNAANEQVARAAAEQKKPLITELKKMAQEVAAGEETLKDLAQQRTAAWRSLPNLPAKDVPVGGEKEAEEVRRAAAADRLKNGPHYLDTVGDLVDLARAAKTSGSRFAFLKGELVRLELALIQLAMEELSKAGFIPLLVPHLIKEEAMRGMGYLDQHAEEIYQTQDDLYLIGTSEQAIGAMHQNEIFSLAELPRRYVGFSSCYRREAGSHGKDVKGILRLHQFDKVEMFSFCAPDESEAEHEFLVSQQEKLMKLLDLPYRVVKLASRDLGGPAAKTYDLETWLPGEGRWRETHSASNTTDYQARRLNIRMKDEAGQIKKVHMLNGTVFAIQRMLIAIIENGRQEDGSVVVPAALQKFVGIELIKKSRGG